MIFRPINIGLVTTNKIMCPSQSLRVAFRIALKFPWLGVAKLSGPWHINLRKIRLCKLMRVLNGCHQGRSQGERGEIPPPKPKKLLQKNGVISESSIFSNKFSKKNKKRIKNSIFLQNFHQKISKFSQNFPTIWVFRPNAQKINAWFVKCF